MEIKVQLEASELEHNSTDQVQIHEIGDETFMTFSAELVEQLGWKAGDQLVWKFDGDKISLFHERELLKQKVNELLAGGPEL